MSWIGLGQGSSMKGANIFFAYANSVGTNVTLSPRLGVGDGDPSTSGTLASLTLLAGSGISNGIMTANVKCKSTKVLNSCREVLTVSRFELQKLVRRRVNELYRQQFKMDLGIQVWGYHLV